jgi:hypothetical protein
MDHTASEIDVIDSQPARLADPPFCPVAISGNNPILPADVMSRCLRILLIRDFDGLVADTDWEEIELDAEVLHKRIAAFANQVRGDIKGLKVDVPDGCIGRLKEIWRPLKRVAVMAGGDWPQRCDRLIEQHVEDVRLQQDSDLANKPAGLVLLEDLHQVFDNYANDGRIIPTKTMVGDLIMHNPAVWGLESAYGRKSGSPLTVQRFGRLIHQATREKPQRMPGGGRERGYTRSQFESTWKRFGVGPVDETGQAGQTGQTGRLDDRWGGGPAW